MSAAEREAERRWPEGLGRWTDPVRGLLLEAFVAGAEWQADHDPRLDAVLALVEQQRIANEQIGELIRHVTKAG